MEVTKGRLDEVTHTVFVILIDSLVDSVEEGAQTFMARVWLTTGLDYDAASDFTAVSSVSYGKRMTSMDHRSRLRLHCYLFVFGAAESMWKD